MLTYIYCRSEAEIWEICSAENTLPLAPQGTKQLLSGNDEGWQYSDPLLAQNYQQELSEAVDVRLLGTKKLG